MAAHDLATPTSELPSAGQIARKVAAIGAFVAVGAVVATQLPGLGEIGHQLAGADGGWIATALVLELASTAFFALAFHGVYGRRTSARASTSMSMAVQGMNIVLPSGGAGGLAVGAVMLDRAGVPRSFAASRTVALFLITSLVSFVAVAIGYFAFDIAALAAAFHAVGPAALPVGLLVLAYTLGHGGALIPIPGRG